MSKSLLLVLLSILGLSVIQTLASPLAERSINSCYKQVSFSQYWIPKEGEKDMLNNGRIVTLTGAKTSAIRTNSGSLIAMVSKTTYEKFQMEGTGLLANGVMVNLDSGKDKFSKVNRNSSPYGLGSGDNNRLYPWVSVASNDIKRGTKLFIKELKGVKLPNGKVHNGCVRVDDDSWSFGKCHLDFFVLQFSSYQVLEKKLPHKVTATESSCTILNYVTDSVQKWAVLK